MIQKIAFAVGVLPDIYRFHPYTENSIFLYHSQAMQFERQFHDWTVGFHLSLIWPPACPLHPMIPSNACHLRITAAAGTEFAVAYSLGTVSFNAVNIKGFTPNKSSLQSENLHPARGVA